MLKWLLKTHKALLIGAVVATVVSTIFLGTRGLNKDYSLAAFVASDSEAYETFRQFMEEFVSNEFAVIAVQSDDAESEATIGLVKQLVSEVNSLEAVERVTSLTDIPDLLRRAMGRRLREHPLIVDNLISRDGKTTAVLMQMSGEGATGAVRKETVSRLKQIVATARQEHPEARIFLAGPYVTLIDMYAYVDRDLLVFSVAAFALAAVTLALVFRRIAPMVFAIGVSAAATLCTLGVASALAIPTALITQMIVILVMILSVATCVHLGVADAEDFNRAPFYEWRQRCGRVLRRMAAPCAAVVITTATGFGSVSISSLTPVHNFGLLMVLGLLLSLIFALVATPALAWSRAPAAGARAPDVLSTLLTRLGAWVEANRRRVVVMFVMVALAFGASIPWLKFESDFVKNFRPGSEVRRSYEFIASNLTPTGSMEIVVRRKDGGAIVSADSIRSLHESGKRIVELFEPVRKANTLADVLTLGPGSPPATNIELTARLALARRVLGQEAIRNFLNVDETALRLNLRVSEGLPVQDKLELAEAVRRLTADRVGPEYETQVTGLYPFYATLVSDLWRDQFRSLSLTIPAVLLVLVIVLRSLKVALIAMVPTTLPIVFCLGAMGWTGIPVNMTTAMMLSVTTGIAVDDVVHYLWRFRSELQETGDYAFAVRSTHGSIGRACVFTTVVIAGGFWILTLSRFLPTAYFGGLLGFTMCAALAADLMLLPALVLIFKPFARAEPA